MKLARMVPAAVAGLWLLGMQVAGAVEPYRIGGGDVLHVTVWKNTDLSQEVTVRPDGMITLPLVRDVRAAGLTALELAEAVAERLGAFVNAPNVTVIVTGANSSRVSTYGAVANGEFPLAGPMNALQLLALAGGALEGADLAAGYVLRGAERIPVNLEPRAGGTPAGGYPALVSGDVLVVPPREATDRILVAGEVRTPQSLPYRPGLTVLDAFVAAGGGTDYSDLDSARVVRRGTGGRSEDLPVDLSRMLRKGDLSRNVTLAPGDIVVVPR